MEAKPLDYREARLSQLRPLYKSVDKPWSKESLRVMPEPEDNYMSDPVREAYLMTQYLAEQQEKTIAAKMAPDMTVETPRQEKAEISTEAKALPKKEAAPKSDPHAPLLMNEAIDVSGPLSMPAPESEEAIRDKMDIKTGKMEHDGEQVAGIGTFNIEWLGTKKRSEEDYKTIAKVIQDVNADVLGIEEISSVDGLKKVLKHMPDYGFVLGKSNDQMLGVIFNKNRASYDPHSIEQVDAVTMGKDGMRSPLSVDMKVDNYDFNFTVLHLKARFDPKSKEFREKQAEVLNQWLKARLQTKQDKDMIIVGDYNDFVDSKTTQNVAKGGIIEYATKEAKPKQIYSTVKYKETIDQIGLSSVKGGATEEFVPGSLRTVDENDYYQYLERVSDHKPMVMTVKSGVDND